MTRIFRLTCECGLRKKFTITDSTKKFDPDVKCPCGLTMKLDVETPESIEVKKKLKSWDKYRRVIRI